MTESLQICLSDLYQHGKYAQNRPFFGKLKIRVWSFWGSKESFLWIFISFCSNFFQFWSLESNIFDSFWGQKSH